MPKPDLHGFEDLILAEAEARRRDADNIYPETPTARDAGQGQALMLARMLGIRPSAAATGAETETLVLPMNVGLPRAIMERHRTLSLAKQASELLGGRKDFTFPANMVPRARQLGQMVSGVWLECVPDDGLSGTVPEELSGEHRHEHGLMLLNDGRVMRYSNYWSSLTNKNRNGAAMVLHENPVDDDPIVEGNPPGKYYKAAGSFAEKKPADAINEDLRTQMLIIRALFDQGVLLVDDYPEGNLKHKS